ncbi:LuxR C-terminal-related transcriptional regulator, partial [Nonomuraea sp. NPDC001684]
LDLIGEGLTNRQIGERMFLAEKTVKARGSVSKPPAASAHSAGRSSSAPATRPAGRPPPPGWPRTAST